MRMARVTKGFLKVLLLALTFSASAQELSMMHPGFASQPASAGGGEGAGIAYDNSAASGNSGQNSLTFSYTVGSGSNRLLIVSVGAVDGTTADRQVSGITYNGVALTRGDGRDSTSEFENNEVWYLLGPASGANNVVVTMGGTCNGISAVAASYTGVQQSSQPDATQTAAITSTTTPSTSITTVADDSLIVASAIKHSATGTIDSAGTDQTIRQNSDVGGAYDHALSDRIAGASGS